MVLLPFSGHCQHDYELKSLQLRIKNPAIHADQPPPSPVGNLNELVMTLLSIELLSGNRGAIRLVTERCMLCAVPQHLALGSDMPMLGSSAGGGKRGVVSDSAPHWPFQS